MNMTIIRIKPSANGFHDNQTLYGDTMPVPEGWCYVPPEMEPLENFPYGEITTMDGVGPDGDDCQVLDTWSPLPIPIPPDPGPEPEPQPTEEEKLKAQVMYTAVMTDTLLEEEEETEDDA